MGLCISGNSTRLSPRSKHYLATFVHLSAQGKVWEFLPAGLAILVNGRGSMMKSTGKRRLAQIACLIAVFVCGSKVVLSQDGVERKVLKKVEPEYPSVLRDKGIGGTVRLRVTVKPDGTVKDVQVLGGNAVLAESASRAVQQWRFAPADREAPTDVTIRFGQRP